LDKTGQYFGHLGFRPGRFFAGVAALTEIISGLLVALGLLGPVGPALMIAVMIVAMVSVHWEHGLFASTNGIEVPLLYTIAALALALTGYGRFSVDAWLGVADRWTPAITAVVVAVGTIGGFANLALHRRQVATTMAATSSK
jgi:putative oxidoreductase